ncbi:MAG: bifunctional nicotinamidase/pyrazinamidase [Acetobacteraceae bacterium]|nr:bifunctional nicotinamidase/pyrazinamidase [Acetobacteraceae bacterium]
MKREWIGPGAMFGAVDLQPTFMPGGELPVPGGDEVIPIINDLLAGPFRQALATQDWHPPGHLSFASAHVGAALFDTVQLSYRPQTLWPDHALQGSRNAELHPAFDTSRVELIIRKGFRPEIDSYSAFRENDRRTATGLHGWLQERGIRRLFLAGLALDFCVAWSAEDAAELGYQVVVIVDACRGINGPGEQGGSADAALERLRRLGVILTTAAAVST